MLHSSRNDRGSRIRAALEWLARSQKVTKSGGSAASYSPLFGWTGPYPETSGYIVPTLWRGADYLGEPRFGECAERMSYWLVELQASDGSFPAGTLRPSAPPKPSIFNTGQIIFGLVEAARRTNDGRFWESAHKAADWLVDQQSSNGRWERYAYVKGYSPSYYSHVCWPLAILWKETGGKALQNCIQKGLSAVLSDRQPNGVFQNWSFRQGQPAFTHTIAYTLQGLIESACVLNNWEQFGVPAAASAEKLLRMYEVRHRLAGAYGSNWEEAKGFSCLTGHCQLASTWMRIFDRTRDPRFLNAAEKAVNEVGRLQRLSSSRPNIHGAVGGSAPFFGKYMRFRYPNWAAKFFLDALLEMDEKLLAFTQPATLNKQAA